MVKIYEGEDPNLNTQQHERENVAVTKTMNKLVIL